MGTPARHLSLCAALAGAIRSLAGISVEDQARNISIYHRTGSDGHQSSDARRVADQSSKKTGRARRKAYRRFGMYEEVRRISADIESGRRDGAWLAKMRRYPKRRDRRVSPLSMRRSSGTSSAFCTYQKSGSAPSGRDRAIVFKFIGHALFARRHHEVTPCPMGQAECPRHWCCFYRIWPGLRWKRPMDGRPRFFLSTTDPLVTSCLCALLAPCCSLQRARFIALLPQSTVEPARSTHSRLCSGHSLAGLGVFWEIYLRAICSPYAGLCRCRWLRGLLRRNSRISIQSLVWAGSVGLWSIFTQHGTHTLCWIRLVFPERCLGQHVSTAYRGHRPLQPRWRALRTGCTGDGDAL